MEYLYYVFSIVIQPRFEDTDFHEHIDNAAVAHWFETARNPLLKHFVPDRSIKMRTLPLFMAHTDYDFEKALSLKYEVEIRTWITHIGINSFTIYHEAWQKKRLCAKGSAVIVHYDFKAGKSTSLPEEKIKFLIEHLKTEE